MPHDEFRKLVERMRQAQKAYFCSPRSDRAALVRAKQLEKMVDEELSTPAQVPGLFKPSTN